MLQPFHPMNKKGIFLPPITYHQALSAGRISETSSLQLKGPVTNHLQRSSFHSYWIHLRPPSAACRQSTRFQVTLRICSNPCEAIVFWVTACARKKCLSQILPVTHSITIYHQWASFFGTAVSLMVFVSNGAKVTSSLKSISD